MSQKYWIPDPYLVQLITLRGQYEDLDGHLTDFDNIYKSGHHLTAPQDSLIRWIFQEVYELWYDHSPLESLIVELSDLVEAIPDFTEWQRDQTISLILQMVRVFPRRESQAETCEDCGYLVVTERCHECEKMTALLKMLRIKDTKKDQRKGTFLEYPGYIEGDFADEEKADDETDWEFSDDEYDSDDITLAESEEYSHACEGVRTEIQIPEIIVTFVE